MKQVLFLMVLFLLVPSVFAGTPAIPDDLSPVSGYTTFLNTTTVICGGVNAENFTIQFNSTTAGADVNNNIGVSITTITPHNGYSGYLIEANKDGNLLKVVKVSASGCDTCRAGPEGGDPAVATGSFVANECTLNLAMTNGVRYTVECNDGAGSHYVCDGCPSFPVAQTDLDFINGWSEGAGHGSAWDLETLVTTGVQGVFNGYINGSNNTVLINLSLGSQTNWSCKACNTTGGYACSDWTSNQTINAMSLYSCTDGDAEQVFNYTLTDEQNDSVIVGDLDFNINGGEILLVESGSSNFPVCLSPVNVTATIDDGIIEYGATETGVYGFNRFYYYTDADIIAGTVSDTSLYLLKSASSTETGITVLKDGLPIDSGILRVKRYDIGAGIYSLVAMATISGGTTQVDLQHTDATYKFEVYSEGSLLCTVPDVSAGGLIVGGDFTLSCFSTGTTTSWWPKFIQLRDAGYVFSVNNITNISSLTYSIPSGVASENCFRVLKWENLLSQQVYYTCTVSAGDTLEYNITDWDANYNLQYVVKINGSLVYQVVAGQWFTNKQYLYDQIGTDSVLYALVLVLVVGMMGLSISAAASVAMTMLGLAFVWAFGILNIGIGALVGILVVGGILLSRLLR